MPGRNGFLYDGDGPDTGGNTPSQPWREDPGAVRRGHTHRLGAEDSLQAHGVPAAAAERHGETSQRVPKSPGSFRLFV